MSRAAMESFIRVMHDRTLCPDFHRAEEDQEVFFPFRKTENHVKFRFLVV